MEEGGGGGLTPHEIYTAVTGGPGSDALDTAQRAAHVEARLESARAERIVRIAGKTAAGWQGTAGSRAYGAAMPLADLARDGADNLHRTQSLLELQSGVFNSVRNSVRPVAPKPPESNVLNDLTPWETDLDGQVKRYQADAQHNLAVYGMYDGESVSNERNLPREYATIVDPGGDISVRTPGSPGGPPPNDGGHGPLADGGEGVGERIQAGGAPVPGSEPAGGSVPPPNSGRPPQQVTDPAEVVPPPEAPPRPLPPPGGPPPPGGVPPGPGPVTGWPGKPGAPVPVGGRGAGLGPDGERGGPGGRGTGGVPGGRGVGWPGSGGERGLRGGEPGAGRPGTGALGPEESAQRRGGVAGAGARGGAAAGGFGPLGVGRGQGDEDTEHQRKYTIEPDPEEVFGLEQLTAPPVIGEED